MAETAPVLSEEEQKLFDEMSKDDKPEPDNSAKEAADKAAADKAAADKAAKEAADKAAEDAKKEEGNRGSIAAALKEARSENKDLRKQLDEMKQIVAQGDQKLQKFIDSAEKRADAPKFEDDPAGNLKHENEQLKKDLAAIRERLEKQDASAKESERLSQFTGAVKAAEAEFAKEHKDYWKAAEHVAEVWRDEFREAGFDEKDLPRLVFGKSVAITNKASESGRNPAEAIYNIAKRYGFAAKPQDEPKDKQKGDSKLKSIEKGLEAAKGAGGGTGPDADDASLASLSQLTDDELDKRVADKDWWAKNIKRTALH